jgi:hypothetical protein
VRPFPSAGVSLQNVDGGTLEQVVVTGIRMVNVRAPLFVRLGERGWGQPVPAAGTLARITINDIVATGAAWTSSIMGVPRHDVANIALSDIQISGKGGGDAALMTRPVPEQLREYPDAARFRNLPAYGLYCRHVTGLRLDRTTFTVDERDGRPALVLDDLRGASVKSFVATAPTGTTPVAWLRATRDCVLDGVRAPDAEMLARLSGAETAKVRVVGVAADPSEQVVLIDPDVQADALRIQGNVTAKSWSEWRRAAGADPGRQLRQLD